MRQPLPKPRTRARFPSLAHNNIQVRAYISLVTPSGYPSGVPQTCHNAESLTAARHHGWDPGGQILGVPHRRQQSLRWRRRLVRPPPSGQIAGSALTARRRGAVSRCRYERLANRLSRSCALGRDVRRSRPPDRSAEAAPDPSIWRDWTGDDLMSDHVPGRKFWPCRVPAP